MSNGEYIMGLVELARTYRLTSQSSIGRNGHMNELELSTQPDQQQVDAVLVDFLNYVGQRRGLDLALYTVDLQQSNPKLPIIGTQKGGIQHG